MATWVVVPTRRSYLGEAPRWPLLHPIDHNKSIRIGSCCCPHYWLAVSSHVPAEHRVRPDISYSESSRRLYIASQHPKQKWLSEERVYVPICSRTRERGVLRFEIVVPTFLRLCNTNDHAHKPRDCIPTRLLTNHYILPFNQFLKRQLRRCAQAHDGKLQQIFHRCRQHRHGPFVIRMSSRADFGGMAGAIARRSQYTSTYVESVKITLVQFKTDRL